MKIVIDDKIPYLAGVFDKVAETVFVPGREITAEHVRDAQALIVRTRTQVDENLLKDSAVKFVGSATIGTDHIDRDWLAQQGIAFSNAPGSNAHGVLQYVVCALQEIAHLQKQSLAGKVLGVVGVGNVGSLVAVAARSLGMEVLLNDPPRALREGGKAFTHIEEIAARADFISFHVPLQTQGDFPTYRMVNAHYLSLMRDDAWLINTSRGEVVDNTALRLELLSGALGGAVLDVWENETTGIDTSLLPLVEISTPHIAGYSVEGKVNATQHIVRAWAQHFGEDRLADFTVDIGLLPIPPNPQISVADLKDPEAAWLRILQQSYDLRQDSANLKANPEDFENLRSNYDFRREFSAHTVELSPKLARLESPLRDLGFAFPEA